MTTTWPIADPHWANRAHCAGVTTDIFYYGDNGHRVWRVQQSEHTNRALDLCNHCPVTTDCLAAALNEEGATSERHGIRGGTTPAQRNQLHRRRTRNGAA